MDTLIIIGAAYLIAVPVAALCAMLVYSVKQKRHRMFWLSLTSLPIAYLIARVAGHLYYDPRPFVVGHFTPLVAQVSDNGFPSDHMLIAATIASVVLYFNRPWGLALWVVALLIGIARVLAGVHHVVDIVGAGIIAIVAVVIAHYILYYLRREHITYISK